MGSRALALDNILSATFFFAGKWTPALKRNQSRDLLRHVLCRLHGASKGDLFHARIRASHANLGAELGLSREWTCKLGQRLREAGWIDYRALRLPDGTFEIGLFSAGRKLKRLLCMLAGYRKPKHRVNEFSHSFPLPQKEREKIFSTARKQQLEHERRPPTQDTLSRLPLLKAWLERGGTNII
jgi:Crp-like helix-turn-helix protein